MSAAVTDPYSVSCSPTRRATTHLGLRQTRRERVGRRALGGIGGVGDLALALDHLHVARCGGQRQLARQQVIAGVAVGDLHDVAAPAELLDVITKNDFHGSPPNPSSKAAGPAAAPA